MKGLIMNQTLIAEATANIIKKDEKRVQEQVQEFKNQLTNVEKNVHVAHTFVAAAFNLFVQITSYRETQEALLSLILDTQHGKINPLLLTPRQFKNQISMIQHHTVSTEKIPGYESNGDLTKLYKIISAKTRVTKEKIIIEINIPLVSGEKYQLFRVIPLPTRHDGKTVEIQPSSQYLSITLDRNKYWLLNDFELSQCNSSNGAEYLCNVNTPIYTANSNVAACEVTLLAHKRELEGTCKIKISVRSGDIKWIALHRQNSWIVTTSTQQSFNIICGDKVTEITVNGTIIMNVMQACQIRNASQLIGVHNVISSRFNTEFLPTINLSEIVKSYTKDVVHTNYTVGNGNGIELEKLGDFINQQKVKNTLTPSRINSMDVHQFSVAYLCMAGILGIVCFGYIQYKKNKETLTNIKNQVKEYELKLLPKAAPRLSRSMFELPNIEEMA